MKTSFFDAFRRMIEGPFSKGFLRLRQVAAPPSSLAALAFLLGGCVSFPEAPAARVEPTLTEDAFVAADGAHLGLSVWGAENPIAVIAAVHGMNDYANAYSLAAPTWAARGIATYAYDQRGFGRSPVKGKWPGAPALKQDLHDFIAALRRTHPGTPVFIAGHSMGAAVVMAAHRDRPLDVEGIILIAPGVWGGAQMPVFYRATLNLAASVMPGKTLTGESAGRQASDNIEFLRVMYEDPNVVKETRLDAVLGVVRMMGEGWDASDEISGDFLVVYGERDDIIPVKKMKKTAARLSGDVDARSYPQSWHLVLADMERAAPLNDIADWISARADRKPPPLARGEEQAVSNRP
jgi:alpha-beta hydrolase superfamily lysophospholipase